MRLSRKRPVLTEAIGVIAFARASSAARKWPRKTMNGRFTNVEKTMCQHGENTSGAINFMKKTRRKRENECDVSLKKNASS